MAEKETDEEQKKQWAKDKDSLVNYITGIIVLYDSTLDNIGKAQADLHQAIASIKADKERLLELRQVYGSEAYLPLNPVTSGTVSVIEGLANHGEQSASRMASTAGAFRTNADALVGEIMGTGSLVASMVSSTVFISERMVDTESITAAINRIREPSATDRKSQLLPKLASIDTGLENKLNGAWQTINDQTNTDRFLQAGSSVRELISNLLGLLSPDDKVISTKWWKQDKNVDSGKTTRKQRTKFAVVGSNTVLVDEDLRPIEHLCKDIDKLYHKLCAVAHLREYEKDLQKMTETLIDQVQIYLLHLFELRQKFYTA